MQRSIELGRAVLSTAAANLELWLRTLITISSKQPCSNFGQQDANDLLEYLASGAPWVGRGHALFIDLKISFKGHCIGDEQLHQLSGTILSAPVWKQLNLRPSLPNDTTQPPGTLRITVRHLCEYGSPAVKQSHRILSSTSAADIQPPDGIHCLSLDSVTLSVEIFELAERRTAAVAKRLKTATDTRGLIPVRATVHPDQEASDELLLEPCHVDPLLALPPALKRTQGPVPFREQKTPLPSIVPSTTHQMIPLIPTIPQYQTEESNKSADLDFESLKVLIDGALRLTVLSRIHNKMLPGMKIKASTFEFGLADIAPILWRPGLLSSISQRVNLLPVIGTSLCQTAAAKNLTSESLNWKSSTMEKLLSSLAQERKPANELDANLAQHVAPRLWLYLMEHAQCKPTTALQSFVSTGLPSTPALYLDEMLEESRQ